MRCRASVLKANTVPRTIAQKCSVALIASLLAPLSIPISKASRGLQSRTPQYALPRTHTQWLHYCACLGQLVFSEWKTDAPTPRSVCRIDSKLRTPSGALRFLFRWVPISTGKYTHMPSPRRFPLRSNFIPLFRVSVQDPIPYSWLTLLSRLAEIFLQLVCTSQGTNDLLLQGSKILCSGLSHENKSLTFGILSLKI